MEGFDGRNTTAVAPTALLVAAAYAFDIPEAEAVALTERAHPHLGPSELGRCNKAAGQALLQLADMMKRNDNAGLATVTAGLGQAIEWIKTELQNSER